MEIRIESQAGLPAVAAAIAGRLSERPVVAFHGSMGAGKTTLIREIANAMGVADEVSSPTFAIVNHYLTAAGKPLYHFDFYRIESLAEALDMGVEEYFDSGDACLVEWPENIAALLPPDTLRIDIVTDPADPDVRTIVISD